MVWRDGDRRWDRYTRGQRGLGCFRRFCERKGRVVDAVDDGIASLPLALQLGDLLGEGDESTIFAFEDGAACRAGSRGTTAIGQM
jgi:hypothetical protein